MAPPPLSTHHRNSGPRDGSDATEDIGWVMVIQHLGEALRILDRIGKGGSHSASNVESALVHAKKELRAARRREGNMG